MKVEEILTENEIVLNFIHEWQSKNDYNPKFLDEYNQKFNTEFEDFLHNSDLSEEIISSFTSK